METERRVVEYVCRTGFADIPPAAVRVIKDQVLAVLGTTIGGAWTEGSEAVADLARGLKGTEEASILVHGGKVPAPQAAFVNAMMARALDFCDAVVPGAHIGSATIAAALAAAEAVGGVSGPDFLAAVSVGAELALRLNLGEPEYDGFDPTGVCVPFSSTAAVAKILGLTEEQAWNALALAFCKCGGSFQANVDGALAVRVIEGWVAETGITCARLASRGITGPPNFLDGVYGYFHLFGRDRVSGGHVLAGLGTDYQVGKIVFKKYPSCGATQASTEMILDLAAGEGFGAADVERVDITVPPYIYKLVGHPFQVGSNPKVNAQFNIRYCVANALVRGGSKLAHFEVEAIKDSEVLEVVKKVEVVPDPAMDARGHTAVDMRVTTKDGRQYLGQTDVAPGFPECPLSKEEHLRRFRECVRFAAKPFPDDRADKIVEAVDHLDESKDVSSLIALLLPT